MRHRRRTIGRQLATMLLAYLALSSAAVAAMIAVATGSDAIALAVGAVPVLGFAVWLRPDLLAGRTARARRRLRRRVGDPSSLATPWRPLLAAAWSARDGYAAAVAEREPSPLRDRLAEHQQAVDAGLERCGTLARCGHDLQDQLRAFRRRRLQAELLVARRRDPDGPRTAALARRLDDADRLRDDVERARLQVEEVVHRLRTVTWRATTVEAADGHDGDPVDAVLDDLAHLRAALADVADVERRAGLAMAGTRLR